MALDYLLRNKKATSSDLSQELECNEKTALRIMSRIALMSYEVGFYDAWLDDEGYENILYLDKKNS